MGQTLTNEANHKRPLRPLIEKVERKREPADGTAGRQLLLFTRATSGIWIPRTRRSERSKAGWRPPRRSTTCLRLVWALVAQIRREGRSHQLYATSVSAPQAPASALLEQQHVEVEVGFESAVVAPAGATPAVV